MSLMHTNRADDSVASIAIVACTHNRPMLLKHYLQQLQRINGCDFPIVRRVCRHVRQWRNAAIALR